MWNLAAAVTQVRNGLSKQEGDIEQMKIDIQKMTEELSEHAREIDELKKYTGIGQLIQEASTESQIYNGGDVSPDTFPVDVSDTSHDDSILNEE